MSSISGSVNSTTVATDHEVLVIVQTCSIGSLTFQFYCLFSWDNLIFTPWWHDGLTQCLQSIIFLKYQTINFVVLECSSYSYNWLFQQFSDGLDPGKT